MSRRQKRGSISDLGSLVKRVDERLVIHPCIAVSYVPDPDSPNRTIQRAERNPPYRQLWVKGGISDEQRNACDRYCHLHKQIGSTGSGGVGVRMGSTTNPAFRSLHPAELNLHASATLTTVHRAIGNDAAALLKLFVVEGQPIVEIARRRTERDDVTKGRVLAAITRLSEHWGG